VIPAPDVPPRGLPEHLPAGERIVWQGAPAWRGLARHALHVRKVAVYFTLLLIWRMLSQWSDGEPLGAILLSSLWLGLLAAGAVAILAGIAWLMARTTVYTVTDRRVVMRIGVALPITLNLPYSALESAQLRLHGDGCGDLPLTIGGRDRIAYLHLWPHARPWQFSHPQPALRCIPDAEHVAGVLAAAMSASAGVSAPRRPSGETAGLAASGRQYGPSGLAGEGTS